MKSGKPSARAYQQNARAEAAEATGRNILQAFGEYMRERWFSEILLEEVAARADVTVRTVIRRFGGKDGLLAAYIAAESPRLRDQRSAPVVRVEDAVAPISAIYEDIGDGVIRNLAQEPLLPELKPMLTLGRREHRALTAQAFATWLEPLDKAAKERAVDLLVVALDVYTWKLLRRDMGRSAAETRNAMVHLVQAVLDNLVPRRQTRKQS